MFCFHLNQVEKDDGYNKREAPPQIGQNNGQIGGGGPGGSGGNYPGSGENYPGNNMNNYPGGFLNRDPTYRREVAVTVEFLVDDEMKDDSKPWTKLTYGADSKDDTCSVKPDDPNCNSQMWWVKVRMSDEESGLHSVQALATGASSQYDEIFFRWVSSF